jgi:hypothetical protein
MNKCVCDICGVENPQRAYKIKERKLMHSYTSDIYPIISWQQVDICNTCFDNLAKLRYEKSLEERTDILLSLYKKRYPDNIDLQSAYLQGVQDFIDMLIQNRVVTK